MREVQASEAKTHLPQLLTHTRHGRAIARIVPETSERLAAVQKTKEALAKFRRTMPKITVEDILSSKSDLAGKIFD